VRWAVAKYASASVRLSVITTSPAHLLLASSARSDPGSDQLDGKQTVLC
jgi:hypothetical protein